MALTLTRQSLRIIGDEEMNIMNNELLPIDDEIWKAGPQSDFQIYPHSCVEFSIEEVYTFGAEHLTTTYQTLGD